MDKEYEKRYHQQEMSSWWFVARREMIFQILNRMVEVNDILDIGCSSGELMNLLRAEGYNSVVGIDISETAVELAKKKGLADVSIMDGSHTSFKDDQFDLIIASDVLEHIEDDAEAIREWKHILRPGGKLIVFVPAKKALWSYHDILNHHKRRYEKRQLLDLLKRHQFLVETYSFWNFLLYFPVVTIRKLVKNMDRIEMSQSEKSDDLMELPTPVNRFLLFLLRIENWLLKWIKFPTGISLYAVCVNDK